MLRRTFFRLVIPLLVVILAFYLLVIPKTVGMITDYPRYTFEYVTQNPELLASFHIGDNRDPSGYGFENFQEVEYTTIYDGLKLSGWYVPSTKDSLKKTLVISHGRTSNRLKALKYLQIVKDYGLDTLYNVFIPDLRNSGKSDEGKTGMGYEFAEDIVGTIRMLQIRYAQNRFVLWGFSMGAMGSATAMARLDLTAVLKENNLIVEKLILASPVSNVEEVLKVGARQRNIPEFLFGITFKKFSRLSDGFVEQMKLSQLLKNGVPTLVLYGTADSQTPADILESEIKDLSNVKAEKFEGAEHVQIYTMPMHRTRYAEAINNFLRD